MDTVFLQCKTPSENSWNASLPGNSPEASTTGRYYLRIRGGGGGDGGFRPGKSTLENAAAFAYDVYERGIPEERAIQTLVVAIDLEDAHNRAQLKLLMDLLVQYGSESV